MHRLTALLHAMTHLDMACSPGTFCASQILGGVSALAVSLAAPVADGGQDQFLWLWRGLITASLLLNLFFVKSVYKKVQRIGPHNRAIATLQVAVEYLATEATEHGVKRQADHLILGMMRDVKKLTEGDD